MNKQTEKTIEKCESCQTMPFDMVEAVDSPYPLCARCGKKVIPVPEKFTKSYLQQEKEKYLEGFVEYLAEEQRRITDTKVGKVEDDVRYTYIGEIAKRYISQTKGGNYE